MRLRSIKVSNVLSYEYLSDFDAAENTIDFKSDLNILIGANGSGKSNILEIIYKLFQTHFFSSYYMEDHALFTSTLDKVVRQDREMASRYGNTLFKNFEHRREDSKIDIIVCPDEGDKRNLKYIFENFEKLQVYANEYCEGQTFFLINDRLTDLEINQLSDCRFTFTVHNNNGESNFVKASILNEAKAQKIFYNYLVFFNQIQTLFEVLNIVGKENYTLLKNPFALISSMRTYGGFANQIQIGPGINTSIRQIHQQTASNSTKSYSSTDQIFILSSLRIGQQFRKLRDEAGVSVAVQKINEEDPIIVNINKVIRDSIGFVLKVENYNPGNDTAMLQIYRGSQVVNFSELSMGQKSIFYLIFSIFGYDVKDGLLIIDEPELHLHVSMQKLYFRILTEIVPMANLQLLIATHSGIFINENTVKNTFRFYKEGNSTSIVTPNNIDQQQKDLIKILSYTNSSRLFFADCVLLVEGDSDEYFYTFFYENYAKLKIPSNKTVEILYINGKGNFVKWRTFLNLFNIGCYFIGDFDNVSDTGVLSNVGLNPQKMIEEATETAIAKIIGDSRVLKTSLDGKLLLRKLNDIINRNFEITAEDKIELTSLWQYMIKRQLIRKSVLVEYLQSQPDDIFNRITLEIEKLYKENIFILKEGDLEDYLNISKDLSNVIHFCQSDFHTWISTWDEKDTKSKIFELTEIFRQILS